MSSRWLRILLFAAVLATGAAIVAPGGVAAQESDLAELAGNGTAEDPYEIADVADLQAIDQDRDAHYVLVDDVDAAEASEWNDGAGFDPVGGVDEAFTGTLDGDEHAIRDLVLEREDQPVGLFAQVGADGRVERLGLENVSVDTSREYEYNGAGLVARNHGELRHVSVTGSVSTDSPSGGIAGYNDGTIASSYAVLEGEGTTTTHAAVAGRNDGTVERVFGVVPEFDCTSGGWAGAGCSGDPGLAIGNDTGTSEHVYEHAAAVEGTDGSHIGSRYEDVTGTSAADTMAALDFEDTWEVTAGFPVFQWQYEGPELPAVGTEAEPFEIRTADDLAEIQKNTSAHFVLAANVDASETADWNGGSGFDPLASTADPFDGSFDGRHYAISNLTIDRPDENEVGFVGALGAGTVSNVSLLDADVTGGTAAGALVGTNNHGTVRQAGATGSVDGDSGVGGLVGQNGGVVEQSFSTASVSGSGQAGGLVGTNAGGMVSHAFAAGPVESDRAGAAGGLVGEQIGGTVEAAYWDAQASGLNDSAGGGVALTTEEMTGDAARSGMDALAFATPPNFDGVWIVTDGYPALAREHTPTGGLAGSGTADDPYWIENVEDLSSIRTDLDAHYVLASDVDASETADWNGRRGSDATPGSSNESDGDGFRPIGPQPSGQNLAAVPSGTFNGSLDGDGHAIHGLSIDRVGERGVGLFASIGAEGSVSNLSVEDADVTGSRATGVLVGVNDGSIEAVAVSGTVRGRQSSDGFVHQTGGLAGANLGTIAAATAEVSVSGDSDVGGIVGWSPGAVLDARSTGEVAGNSNVGGLVGEQHRPGRIENGTSAATVVATGETPDALGGLVGEQFSGRIVRSSAHGDVEGTADSYALGGLLGDRNGGSIQAAYARGNVSGRFTAGGLIGQDNHGPQVTSVFATGRVETTDSEPDGVLGSVNVEANYTNAYWDVETTGANSTVEGTGTGLATHELTGENATAALDGFDFEETWRTTDGYPVLTGENERLGVVDADWSGSADGLRNESSGRETVREDCATATTVDGTVVCDVDGDGNFRDVTGDGSVTNTDVTHFFSVQHVPPFDERTDLFDFDGDEEVGQSDVVALFEYVAG